MFRDDAYKLLVPITDDGVLCSWNGMTFNDADTVAGGEATAAALDAALLALSPTFGTAAQRNYTMASIVAMAYNMPVTQPYASTDPILATTCPTAADPGTGYQALSVLTGGLRYPICDTFSYDVLFQSLAQTAIAKANISCTVPLPNPGGPLPAAAQVLLEYFPGGAGASAYLPQVANAAACVGAGYSIENDAITLCPDTCTAWRNDGMNRRIDVLYGCP